MSAGVTIYRSPMSEITIYGSLMSESEKGMESMYQKSTQRVSKGLGCSRVDHMSWSSELRGTESGTQSWQKSGSSKGLRHGM